MKYTKTIFAASVMALFTGVSAHAEIVSQDALIRALAGKQDTLSAEQQAATDSGVTKEKLAQYTADIATALGKQDKISVLGGAAESGKVVKSVTLNEDGKTIDVEMIEMGGYELPKASDSVLGGVKIGTGVSVSDDGTISVALPDVSNLATKEDVTSATSDKQNKITVDGKSAAENKYISGVTYDEATSTVSVTQADLNVDAVSGLSEAITAAMPTIDDALNDSSTNAVQNKVVNAALAGKEDTANRVTTVNSSSTDTTYPTAKAVDSAITTAIAALDGEVTGSGFVSSISQTDGKLTATLSQVTIPIGDATNPTGQAQIWVQ